MNDNLKNKILLIDNSINVDSINFDSEFNKIITLDYLSHEKLQNKKIKHTVSDVFISDSEFKNLDQLSHNFLKWHDNSKIKKLITHKNINLGKLFESRHKNLDAKYWVQKMILKKYLKNN